MPSKKRKRTGRPKGSTTRGPTRQVGLRLSEDLWKKIDRLRRQSAEIRTQTGILEELLRIGLDAREG